jgi:hypothetical protein
MCCIVWHKLYNGTNWQRKLLGCNRADGFQYCATSYWKVTWLTVRDVASRPLYANALQRMMASDGVDGNIRGNPVNTPLHCSECKAYRIDERGESLGLTSPQYALDKLVGDHENGCRTKHRQDGIGPTSHPSASKQFLGSCY